MKNIHIIPTGKPSRLISSGKEFTLLKSLTIDKRCQHIYITNDEEIKEGEWILFQGILTKALKGEKFSGKEKIILTTDQDLISKTCVHNFVNILNDSFKCVKCKKEVLRSKITISDIKDGVQSIPDEFLEYFIKNPSCEEVEVKPLLSNNGRALFGYKIIIPKEEPKQECYICPHTKLQCDDECCVSAENCHIKAGSGILLEPKQDEIMKRFIKNAKQQETIEEAAERCFNDMKVLNPKGGIKEFMRMSLNFGVKYQQENSYSEEDMKLSFEAGYDRNTLESLGIQDSEQDYRNFKEWFEKYKKK